MKDTIRQEFYFKIGNDDVSIGKILNHTPEFLVIECVVQNPQSVRNSPVCLTRVDTWGSGFKKEYVVFDGVALEPQSVLSEGEVVYVNLTCISSSFDAIRSTILTVMRPDSDMSSATINNVENAFMAKLVVPEAQFIYADLLRKDNVYPEDVVLRFLDSVMHLDAIELYEALVSLNDRLKAVVKVRNDGTAMVAPALIGTVLEYDYKPVSNSLIKKTDIPGIFFGDNILVLDVFSILKNATLDTDDDIQTFFNEYPLAVAVLTYFVWQGLSIRTSSNDPVFLGSDTSYMDAVMTLDSNSFSAANFSLIIKKVSYTQNELEFTPSSDIDNGLGADPDYTPETISTKGERKFQIVSNSERRTASGITGSPLGSAWVTSKENEDESSSVEVILSVSNLPKYMNKALIDWLTDPVNVSKFDFNDADYQKQLLIAKNILAKSSFKRSGTNSATLKYWNSRVNEKILDLTKSDKCPKQNLDVMRKIGRRAGMDIVRRQLSFITHGSLWDVLTTFFTTYFLQINSTFPLKRLSLSEDYGDVVITSNGSMELAPSSFIPLMDWMTEQFEATYKVQEDDVIFIVKDKIVRDMVSKNSPPYVYDFKKNELIEMGDYDNIFKDDYLRSFYRKPVMRELTIDRSLLMAMMGQKEDSVPSKLADTLTFNNDTKDAIAFIQSVFRAKFAQYFESINTTLKSVPESVAIDLPGLEDLAASFLEVAVPLNKSNVITLSVNNTVKAILDSYMTFYTMIDFQSFSSDIMSKVNEYQTFYPIKPEVVFGLEDNGQPLPASKSTIGENLKESILSYFNLGVRPSSGMSYDAADDSANYQKRKYSELVGPNMIFSYKLNSAFAKFMKNYLVTEEGRVINPNDGNQPSFYGLKIDKLLFFCNLVGSKSYSSANLARLSARYIGACVARQFKRYNKSTYSSIVNDTSTTPVLPDLPEKEFYKIFPDLTEDEACEITYRLIYKGDLPGQNKDQSLLRGDSSKAGYFPYLAVLLDVVYQHGPGLVAPRFWKWINGTSPRWASIGASNGWSWKLSPERLKVWRKVFKSNENTEQTTRVVIDKLVKLADMVSDKKTLLTDMMGYRSFCLVDSSTFDDNYKGYKRRWTAMKAWAESLVQADFEFVPTTGLTPPQDLDQTLFTKAAEIVRAMVSTEVESSVQDYLQLPVSSGLSGNFPLACTLINKSFIGKLINPGQSDLELEFETEGGKSPSQFGLCLNLKEGTLTNAQQSSTLKFTVITPAVTTTTAVRNIELDGRLMGTSQTTVRTTIDQDKSRKLAELSLYFGYIGFLVENIISTGDPELLTVKTIFDNLTPSGVGTTYTTTIFEGARFRAEWDLDSDNVTEGSTWYPLFRAPVSANGRVLPIVKGLLFWQYLLEGIKPPDSDLSRSQAIDKGKILINDVLSIIKKSFEVPELYKNESDEFSTVKRRLPFSLDSGSGLAPSSLSLKPASGKSELLGLNGYKFDLKQIAKVGGYDQSRFSISSEKFIEMAFYGQKNSPIMKHALIDLAKFIILGLGVKYVGGAIGTDLDMLGLLRFIPIHEKKERATMGTLDSEEGTKGLSDFLSKSLSHNMIEVSGGSITGFWEINISSIKYFKWSSLWKGSVADRWSQLCTNLYDPLVKLGMNTTDSDQDKSKPVSIPQWADQGMELYVALKEALISKDVPLIITIAPSGDKTNSARITLTMDTDKVFITRLRSVHGISIGTVPVLMDYELEQNKDKYGV